MGLAKLCPADLRNELECPVCFAEMKPPVHIWQSAQGHPVCQPCRNRPEVRHCPTCRQRIVGRATLVEKIAAQVFKLKAAKEACASKTKDIDAQIAAMGY